MELKVFISLLHSAGPFRKHAAYTMLFSNHMIGKATTPFAHMTYFHRIATYQISKGLEPGTPRRWWRTRGGEHGLRSGADTPCAIAEKSRVMPQNGLLKSPQHAKDRKSPANKSGFVASTSAEDTTAPRDPMRHLPVHYRSPVRTLRTKRCPQSQRTVPLGASNPHFGHVIGPDSCGFPTELPPEFWPRGNFTLNSLARAGSAIDARGPNTLPAIIPVTIAAIRSSLRWKLKFIKPMARKTPPSF